MSVLQDIVGMATYGHLRKSAASCMAASCHPRRCSGASEPDLPWDLLVAQLSSWCSSAAIEWGTLVDRIWQGRYKHVAATVCLQRKVGGTSTHLQAKLNTPQISLNRHFIVCSTSLLYCKHLQPITSSKPRVAARCFSPSCLGVGEDERKMRNFSWGFWSKVLSMSFSRLGSQWTHRWPGEECFGAEKRGFSIRKDIENSNLQKIETKHLFK